MTDRPRSLQQLAKEALDVQDACNLSGVAHGFARVMADLCHHVQNTDERNRHPIATVWANKIADLAGAHDYCHHAYEACRVLAQGEGGAP